MLKIFSSLINSIVMITTVYIFGKATNKKIIMQNKAKVIIVNIVLCILNTLVCMYTEGTEKTLLMCMIYTIFINVTFSIEFGKSMLLSILFILLLIIPDFITAAVSFYILNLSKEYVYNTLSGGLIANTSTCLIMILLILTLKKPLGKLENYKISSNKQIILISIMTLLFVAIFFYKYITAFEINQNIIIYLIAIFAFMIILFSLLKQKVQNDNLQNRHDELLEVMKTYESDVEHQRTIIHETQNEIMTIRCKIKDKQKEEAALQYIDSILGDKTTTNMSKYSKFKYLPSNGLKGFFYYKFMEAERRNINVSVNIASKIEKSFLAKLDVNNFKQLARIIGVYLDNAIEASELSKEKKLGIEIYLTKGNVEIIITNTFANKIDKDKIGNSKFSTKGKNRGHGLLLVRNILNNTTIFDSNTKILGNLYIQTLIVKNPQKDK